MKDNSRFSSIWVDSLAKNVLGGDSRSSISEALGLRRSSPLWPGSEMSGEHSSIMGSQPRVEIGRRLPG